VPQSDYYLPDLIRRFRKKGVLVDTNLMLCYVIGHIDPERIPTFKRTQQYLPNDFYLLKKLLGFFSCVVTTPNILTEVENLGRSFANNDEDRALASTFSQIFGAITERYVPTKQIVDNITHQRFGITDAATILLADEDFLVITDDLRLYQKIIGLNKPAININHIRTL
jgi:hypothetical protein